MLALAVCCLVAFILALKTRSAPANRPLEVVARLVRQVGHDRVFDGDLANRLGLTTEKQAITMKEEVGTGPGGEKRYFDVSSNGEILMIVKSQQSLADLYKTTTAGLLLRAMQINSGGLQEIPTASAQQPFTREKAFWLGWASANEPHSR